MHKTGIHVHVRKFNGFYLLKLMDEGFGLNNILEVLFVKLTEIRERISD